MSDKKTRREAVESMATTILNTSRQSGQTMSYEQAKDIAIRAEKINRKRSKT